MNIFFTSNCPKECATYLDDKRVVKMCLETAQLLATAINEHGGKATYKTTHKNHPSAIWVRQNKSNYVWTIKHFISLCHEYKKRYGKTHKSYSLLSEFINNINLLPDGELSTFANCAANNSLNISYKHIKDIPKAYQLYLNDRWDNDKREPTWYKEAR